MAKLLSLPTLAAYGADMNGRGHGDDSSVNCMDRGTRRLGRPKGDFSGAPVLIEEGNVGLSWSKGSSGPKESGARHGDRGHLKHRAVHDDT